MLTTLMAMSGLLMAEPTNLSRVYKADDKITYTLKADVNESGNEIKAEGELLWMVKKALDGGKAEASLTTVKFGMFSGGTEMQNMDGGKVEDTFGPNGLPQNLEFSQNTIPGTIFLAVSSLPGKALNVGDKYKIDWTSKDNKLTLKGDGKFDSIKEVAGKKRIVLKPVMEVSPEGEQAAQFEFTCEYDFDTLLLIHAEGKVVIEGTDAKVVIDQKKKV